MKKKVRMQRNLTRLQLFEEVYGNCIHNLLCYSKDYLMTEPKEQFVKEWKIEKEKAELLNEIVQEELLKEGVNYMSFSQEQILKM